MHGMIGGLALVVFLGGTQLAEADKPTKQATSELNYQSGSRLVSLDRDSQGRWRKIETTRLEFDVIMPRSRRTPVAIYRAPAMADVKIVRTLGQKLANRENGSIAIICDGLRPEVLTFSPIRRVAMR